MFHGLASWRAGNKKNRVRYLFFIALHTIPVYIYRQGGASNQPTNQKEKHAMKKSKLVTMDTRIGRAGTYTSGYITTMPAKLRSKVLHIIRVAMVDVHYSGGPDYMEVITVIKDAQPVKTA
jgi:hypothetical protein